MNVSYFQPLQRSGERARRMLFAPFRIEMWFTLGFAAFLSEWMTGGGGGGSMNGARWEGNPADLQPVVDRVRDFLQNPLVLGAILWIVAAGVALIILFQWIGARGKFVFLDDVVRECAAIREPWARFARLGTSLFLFRLLYLVVVLLVVGGILWVTAGSAITALLFRRDDVRAVLAPVLGGLLVAFAFAFLFWLVLLMLDAFVVPIMYRQGVEVTEAWRRFLPLLGRHWVAFLVFTLIMMVLHVAVVVLVVMLGLMTCCVGFVLMITPYLGQVVLLPIHVLLRGFGPEFLAQFGPEFDAFAATRGALPAPPAPPVPPGTGA